MTDTLILHRACDTPIFVVRGGIGPGDPVEAHAWEPLDAEWPHPEWGEMCVCPNCHEPFGVNDRELLRTNVDAW